jgi:hypothetical protein
MDAPGWRCFAVGHESTLQSSYIVVALLFVLGVLYPPLMLPHGFTRSRTFSAISVSLSKTFPNPPIQALLASVCAKKALLGDSIEQNNTGIHLG